MENGASVEDLHLFFTLPGTEIELKEGGKDVLLTIDNLDEYLGLLLDCFGNTIKQQIKAFRKGFETFISIDLIRFFKT